MIHNFTQKNLRKMCIIKLPMSTVPFAYKPYITAGIGKIYTITMYFIVISNIN